MPTVMVNGKPVRVENRNVVLTRKINNVLYALAVRTTTDAVFDTKYKYTLTEMLSDISDALVQNFERIAQVSEAFNRLMQDCPAEFDTLKEIYDYIHYSDDSESELIRIIKSKQDAEEGKGLSTHDLTDVLYQKLVNGYSKEDLDDIFTIHIQKIDSLEERVRIIEQTPNIFVGESNDGIKEGDVWFYLVSRDEG